MISLNLPNLTVTASVMDISLYGNCVLTSYRPIENGYGTMSFREFQITLNREWERATYY